MIYSLLFFLVFVSGNLPDNTIEEDVEHQVSYFASDLKAKKNQRLNLWALHEIASSSCHGFRTVKEHLSKLEAYSHILQNEDCESKQVNVSSKFFWEKSDLDLFNKIIASSDTINEKELPFTESPFIHYELLLSNKFSKVYTKNYLSKAIVTWKELAQFHNENNNHLNYSLTISNIIWASYYLDDFKTLSQFSERIVSSKYLPFSDYRLRIYGAVDYSFYAIQQYDQSLKLQRESSIPLAKYLHNERQIWNLKIRQGVYLYYLGKYEESKEIYEELYAQRGIDDFYLFTNLGINYYKLGYSNKYISFQLRALEYDFSNYKNLLSVYRNLFIYYTSNKDIQSALGYIKKAKDVALANEDTTELALIDSYLGTFYWSQYQDHQKALANFNSAQKILDPDKNYANYIDLLYDKGNVYLRIDSLDRARQVFEEGKALALSKSNTVDYLDGLINLADIELRDQELVAAKNLLEEIKLYSLENVDFPLLTKFFTIKSKLLRLTSHHRDAIEELTPVVAQVIDRAKNNTDSQEGYWSVEDEYLDAIQLLVELHIESNSHTEALTILDQLKTINDAALYNSPLVKAAKLSEEDLAEEKRLNQRLQNLRKRYLNANENNRFELKQEIDRVSALREQILSDVDLDKSSPLSPIWAIQRSISDNELVLHFTEIGSTLYISRLTKDQIEIRSYNFDSDQKKYVGQIADALASGNTDLLALHDLYKKLELNKLPSDIENITVIPDNFLYRIPLEVLPAQKPDSPISFGSTRYLIEDYSFRYFTSLKEFQDNRRSTFSEKNSTYDFSGFAISDFQNFDGVSLPSLPYATIETQNIRSVLSSLDDKVIFTGENATKEAFKSRVGNSRLVHVATHSEVSEQDPLFSTIYLRTTSSSDTTLQSDQALYAYELFDTPLNSEFIMLNSCSSGSGNYIQGSGIMGISRALRYAGAKSLALNLWAVNDKVASEFATEFYSSINEGSTKNEAIRNAKLDQLKTGNANPHFWGAYTMIGNPSPVTSSTDHRNLFIFLLTGATIMFGLMAYSSPKK